MSKLEILQERFICPTGFGGTMFITEYSNSNYIVSLNEFNKFNKHDEHRSISVDRKDADYSPIHTNGIKIYGVGISSPTEVEAHIQRLIHDTDTHSQIFEIFGEDTNIEVHIQGLIIAKDTFNQIVELFGEGINILCI